MISVNELYSFVSYVSNKTQASGNISPSKFNLVLKRAYTEWVTEKYNDPNKQQQGDSSRYGYQLNQKVTDDLKHLIVPPKTYQVGADGRMAYPADYLHISSCRYRFKKQLNGCDEIITKEVDVRAMKDSEIGHILTSQIVHPTKRYPYLAFYDTYMQFFPKDLGAVVFTYLRKPETPIWAFITVSGRPVYDPANSVNVDAPDEAMNEIAFRMLSFLGINVREQMLIQYSEQKKALGV